MREWEWQSADIEWKEELGAGSFGRVFRVECDGLALAAKRMASGQQEQAERAIVERRLRSEFRALSRLQHPNIVRILGVVLDHPEWVCLLMELAERGSLRQLLNATPEAVVGRARVQLSRACDVVCGLAYLHTRQPKPVLHRDVKSANVLLFAKGHGVLEAKVADFGLAIGFHGTSLATSAQIIDAHPTVGWAWVFERTWQNLFSKPVR